MQTKKQNKVIIFNSNIINFLMNIKKIGKRFLKSRSPSYFADRIKHPILIIHSSDNSKIKQFESNQFIATLKRKKIPFMYIIYPDEKNGIYKHQNILSMAGFIEKFLHKCLNGKVEPYTKEQYKSSANIIEMEF